MTRTFDNKRQVRPVGLMDVDAAFLSWFDNKLNLHLSDPKGERKKVPVRFVAPERWSLAREEGIRDEQGILLLPIVSISRTSVGGPNEAGYQRIFADLNQDHSYYKKINQKSSLVKELVKNRPKEIDPTLPIFEVYTHRAPDHYVLTYEVDVWTTYITDMNTVIEKIGQELNFRSVKSFYFETKDGYGFNAFQEEGLNDESNLEDFTGKERIVRKTFTFKVPASIMPQSDERRDQFKRYFTQTRIVIKESTALSYEDFVKLTEDKK